VGAQDLRVVGSTSTLRLLLFPNRANNIVERLLHVVTFGRNLKECTPPFFGKCAAWCQTMKLARRGIRACCTQKWIGGERCRNGLRWKNILSKLRGRDGRVGSNIATKSLHKLKGKESCLRPLKASAGFSDLASYVTPSADLFSGENSPLCTLVQYK
jgi:hypothetical protein